MSRFGTRFSPWGLFALLLLFNTLLAPTQATAQGSGQEKDTKEDSRAAANSSESKDNAKEKEKKDSGDKTVVTEGQVEIDGKVVPYQAITGKLVLKEDGKKNKAEMFFVAYTRTDIPHKEKRPVTFCFNGGPGSSSVWLHLGMLGPKRIVFPDDATPIRPPYGLVSNTYSLLDTTDLVFIDPVSTGYSRPADGESKEQFHGYEEDLRSVGQFIYDWTSKYERWLSPKYLLGESYGGIRAAGLAGYLQDRYYMELNGIVIVSGVINFQTLRFGGSNDLPYIAFLPSYAATAWYHKRLAPELQSQPVGDVVAQAEKFASGPYASALLNGTRLSEEEIESIAQQTSRLTGLAPKFIQRSNLRIDMDRFAKELLREEGRTVGRFDSRYKGIDRDNAGDSYEYDASGAAIFGPFTATFNDYVRTELRYTEDRVYEILTGNVQPWSYRRFEGRYVDGTDTLRKAMTSNPYLKLFLACGYTDLATPHFAMMNTVDHLMLDRSLRPNISAKFYEGGHMMYIYEPSLQKLRRDLLEFYQGNQPIK